MKLKCAHRTKWLLQYRVFSGGCPLDTVLLKGSEVEQCRWQKIDSKRMFIKKKYHSYWPNWWAWLGDRHGKKMWKRWHRSNMGAWFTCEIQVYLVSLLACRKYKHHGHPCALFSAIWLLRNTQVIWHSFPEVPWQLAALAKVCLKNLFHSSL